MGGQGKVVHADILHPNGNVYDQILITGESLTVAADVGQIVRVAFIDLTNDIVQCEFSGSGTMRIDFDPSTFSSPAPPVNYVQPSVKYAKGLASITLEGTDEFSSVAIYTIGTATSNYPALFKDDVIYDGLADIAVLKILGSDISNIFTGDVRYSAKSGITGVDAAGTKIHGRLVLHDIDALEDAQPVLRIADDSPLSLDEGSVLIAAGDLHQSNSAPVDIRSSSGTASLSIMSVGAIRSSGETIAIRPISRLNQWQTGGGSLVANNEPIVSAGLATYPTTASQLSNFRYNPFQISEYKDGFFFYETSEKWKYEEIQHQDGIEASITFKGDFIYKPNYSATGFDIVLDYNFHAISLAGFTKTTAIENQSDPPQPKSAIISVRSNGDYEYQLTLTDGTEQVKSGTYTNLNKLRLPGLGSPITQP